MNIRSVQQSTTRSLSGLNIRRRLFELFPKIELNSEKFNNIGTYLSRPHVNRAVMGGTALLTQPFIDYNNPKVDEDTAKVSTARTIGKILAGTMVGCAVRWGCYVGVGALTKTGDKAISLRRNTLLMPDEKTIIRLAKNAKDWLKNYRSIVSTIIGLGVMLITNVALDVPITNFITQKILKHFNIKEKSNPKQQESIKSEPGSYDVRKKFEDIFINKPEAIKKGAINGRYAS